MRTKITDRQRVLSYFTTAPSDEAISLYEDISYLIKQRRSGHKEKSRTSPSVKKAKTIEMITDDHNL